MSTVVCILVPRFGLLAAADGGGALLSRAVALAPEPGREQAVGEVSGAAEALGVRAGMPLGEALARCPELRLVAADPDRAAAAWESVLCTLEGIGAAVESTRPGEAYFVADGLRRLYGGHLEGVLAQARRALGARGAPVRIGAAPSRFCSFAAAGRARPGRRAAIVPGGAARAFLAPLPVRLLRAGLGPPVSGGRRGAGLPATLERLGIRTLGELAALSVDALADRFGRPGLRAHRLARGLDTPLKPRSVREPLVERLDLPEAASGPQLERMLELLVDRLLARPERRGRAFRRLRLGGRFVERGTWRQEVTLRRATAARDHLCLVLAPKLGQLPAPIVELSLTAVTFGAPVGDQLALKRPGERERRRRIVEALRQVRATAGTDSVLRVLEVDPDSRIPERRALLTPFPE